MIWKIIGSILIIASCGGFGIHIAAMYRNEIRSLKMMIDCIDYMQWELQYRLTDLPALFKQIVVNCCEGSLKNIFEELTNHLEQCSSYDVQHCMEMILSTKKDIPADTKNALYHLGRTLGKFDLNGQINGLKSVRDECKRRLNILLNDQTTRIRSYKTLGFSAGAALVIILF